MESPNENKIKLSGILSEGYGLAPNKILFDKELDDFAARLGIAILSLCAERGYCWASNKYLADQFGCSVPKIRKYIPKLEKHFKFGYENHKYGSRRTITPK